MGRPRRRFRSARFAIALAFLSLLLAALLNAQGLRKTAFSQPDGLGRDLALAVTRPLVSVSHFLYLDRPRQELKAAIGRGTDDRVDTRVALPALPPAKPKPKPIVKPAAPRHVTETHHRRRPAPHRRPPLPPRQRFTPDRPLRVWVAGDSLAEVPGQALERATASRGAVHVLSVESRVSTGLERPEIYNWFTRFQQVVRDVHPQVAVLSLGADDDHDFMTGVPAGVTLGKLGSKTWTAEYARRVAGVTRELNAAGIYVVWLGLPITRGEGWNKPYRVINRILKAVAAASPKAYYVDAWKLFEDKRGRYTDYLPNAHGQLVLMRSSDGVHYQPAGGDLVARAVLHRLNQVYDLTGWRRGSNS
jgi:hypothetical protein